MEIKFPGGKRVDAQLNEMVIKTDQPIQAGGTGTAPAPFDLFLASIGTCAGIYVLGFCQSRGINSEGIKIQQKMNYNPNTRMIDKIDLEIFLPNGFPEKYKSAVIHVAEMCTVKKHLQDPPKFEISTKVTN